MSRKPSMSLRPSSFLEAENPEKSGWVSSSVVPLDVVGCQAHLVQVSVQKDLHGDNCRDRLLGRLLEECLHIGLVVTCQREDGPAGWVLLPLRQASDQEESAKELECRNPLHRAPFFECARGPVWVHRQVEPEYLLLSGVLEVSDPSPNVCLSIFCRTSVTGPTTC